MKVFVGDPPVGGFGVCRWVPPKMLSKECRFGANRSDPKGKRKMENGKRKKEYGKLPDPKGKRKKE